MISKNAAPGLHFYTYAFCPFCRPVDYLLKANKVEYTEHHLNLRIGEHKTGEYKKVNPFERVPAIIDNGYVIFESNTVMRYVSNSQNVAEHWYPKDPQTRGFVDLYFDWHAANILNLIKYGLIKIGIMKGDAEEAKKNTDKALSDIENVFLAQRKYLATEDKPSIADLALFWQLSGTIDRGVEITPRVKEYYNNLLSYDASLKESRDQFLEGTKENARKKQEEDALKAAEAKA
jgi:glutathione S-transferase